MRKETGKRKPRLALTILFSVVILFFMMASSLLVAAVTMYRVKNGLFTLEENVPSHNRIVLSMVVWSTTLGTALSVVLGRISLRPVNKVIDAMDSLAHGNFKQRLAFPSKLGRHPTAVEVTDSFNHMAEELEKTEMLRSDFVNNFSHEFKTPIVSIAGFADLLLEEELTEEERREYIRIISQEAHRLSDMATNVLNLTKIENQTILTDVTRFNLSEQIRGCLLLLENKWTEKALTLEVDFGEYEYSGSRELLREVWLNLLDNAVKFAFPGGTIKIGITETMENILVSVSNTGPEIPRESMDRIFNKFYQADESHATGGYGIGLSIVRAVVELHGGKILASSGGGWTVFTVVLPI